MIKAVTLFKSCPQCKGVRILRSFNVLSYLTQSNKELNKTHSLRESSSNIFLTSKTTIKNKSVKLKIKEKCPPKNITQKENSSRNLRFPDCRISSLNIQMLSSSLYQQIFGSDLNENNIEPTSKEVDRSITHLKQNGLWGKEPSISPPINCELPSLNGKNVEEHFRVLGEKQCKPFKELLNNLISSSLPELPLEFEFSKGWTRYNEDGSKEKVDFPPCSSLIFDIEVCVSEGRHPTLACAVSDKHWYTWCSNCLIDNTKVKEPKLEDLIPMGNDPNLGECKEKIIIGHNVSFDRLAVKEEYYIQNNNTRYLDTMSMHIAVSGLVEEQRNILLKNKKAEKKIRLPWMNVGCTNSLKDVYKFYCGKELQKESRDIFVKGSLSEVRENFQQLMQYCALDVAATYEILVKLYPMFLERFSHPVTLAGMLEMSTAYLPVCDNWSKYKVSSEKRFEEFNDSLTSELVQQALEALKLQETGDYKFDPWLWDLDWNLPKGRVKKLQNYPNWYRKLCMRTKLVDGSEKPQSMSTSLKIVPKLLRLTWKGYPLHYERSEGWGYIKPNKTKEIIEGNIWDKSKEHEPGFPVDSLLKLTSSRQETASEEDDELPGLDIGIPNVKFFPLPHKNGEGYNVGNPLSKDFLRKLEDNTLSSAVNHVAQLVLKTTKTISYWKNNRDRIHSQMVINLDNDKLPSHVKNSDDYKSESPYGAILPQVVTAGTITRRAVEKTWMTASNAYQDRIGSELKAMVKAPPGYHFVGADVDSQELWIASVLGDAYHSGQHGSTALGWMTLQGTKAEGTDMHSRTAKTAGISRDNAKVINYGRIYGAGLQFMQRLLKQFNPSLTSEETKQKAVKLFATTKGEKGWYLNSQGIELCRNLQFEYNGQPFTRKEVNRLLKIGRNHGHFFSKDEIIKNNPVWVGGSESHMFNCLEAIARMNRPRTPVLGARITRALEPWCVDDQFMTSRVNWVVQSSAVDFLHLMLVSMRWLMSEYKIDGRFSISIHDEVRYLISSEDRYRAALALHITNLLTRSFISLRLGLYDLPQSVAFFSGVDIDKVLRKEPDMDCITPSNPDGLLAGYDIPKGETLNIYQVLERTKGKLTPTEKIG